MNAATKPNVLKFSYNWNNKLNCKAFTTIRLHSPHQYRVGKRFTIDLKGEFKGEAEIKAIRTIEGEQLNEFTCFIDTGYSRLETLEILRRMYGTIDIERAMFDFCLLVYTIPGRT